MTVSPKTIRNTVFCTALLAMTFAGNVSAKSLFDGCPSNPIMQRFIEFGKSGKMPRDLGKWLNTPADQKVEPWKPFDNVDFVGVCWVSAWLIHTDDGVVMIDGLYGPFTNMLIENIEKTGTDLADIKYVLMTHGHRDHAGGAAAAQLQCGNGQHA